MVQGIAYGFYRSNIRSEGLVDAFEKIRVSYEIPGNLRLRCGAFSGDSIQDFRASDLEDIANRALIAGMNGFLICESDEHSNSQVLDYLTICLRGVIGDTNIGLFCFED